MLINSKIFSFLLLFNILFTYNLSAQQKANYDEAQIPPYRLPELLVSEQGQNINTARQWWEIRRPELFNLFQNQVYGKVPEADVKINFTEIEKSNDALFGKAIRKQIKISVSGNGQQRDILMLIYLPNNQNKPVPLFLGLNFYGNHTIYHDTAIVLTKSWIKNNEKYGITNNQATQASRGARIKRWPVESIISRGYGLATIYYGDIDPDFDDSFQNGIHPLFYKQNQIRPAPFQWGSIAAWAWGLTKAMDYFERDKAINHKKIAVIGHSRLGKSSLWAGALDRRFALVISNNSGCGGAALSRRRYGETIAIINNYFPHWFCGNFKSYSDREGFLPVDQHMLVALIAPRPVYIASAIEDQWADPKGEFLSAKTAGKVYELLGAKQLGTNKFPSLNQPVNKGDIAYHVRTGKHDITFFDWQRYLDFAAGKWKN